MNSSFYLQTESTSNQMEDLNLNIAEEEGHDEVIETKVQKAPGKMTPEIEKILPDVLYALHFLMGKGGEWRVDNKNLASRESSNVGIRSRKTVDHFTTVRYEDILQFLQNSLDIDSDIIQAMIKDVQERNPPEFYIDLTVIEGDIQCQKDSPDSTNSHVRMRISRNKNNGEQLETPVIMNSLRPKWKYKNKLKLSNVYNDDIIIELWHEKEEDRRKRRHFIRSHLRETSKEFLLAELRLPLKNTVEQGINGWYTLENRFGTNMKEPTRLQLSGQFTCSQQIECENAKEAYDDLLKFFIRQQRNSSEDRHTNKDGPCGNSKEDESCVTSSSKAVLSQMALILNYSPSSQLLSWWAHVTLSKSTTDWILLSTEFNQIKASLVMGSFSEEERQFLGQFVSRVIDLCITCLKNLDICFPAAFPQNSKVQLTSMLQTVKSIQDNPSIRSLLMEKSNFNIQEFIKAALQGFYRQWWNKMADILKNVSGSTDELLCGLVTITNEVYNLLQVLQEFYHDKFLNELDICCIKVAYRTIVMELIEVIEPHIVQLCKAVPASKESIDDNGIKCDFLRGSHLMKIYKNIIKLCGFQCSHMTKAVVEETRIEEFPYFFKQGIENQLSLTTSREYDLLKDIVHKDDFKAVGPQTPFSASLLEATAIPHRMKIWWFELVWPEAEDRMVYLKTVLKSLIFLSVFYCQTIINRTNFIVHDEDDVATRQQLVNKKICIAITNMDNMTKEIKKYPDILGYKSLSSQTNHKHDEEIQSMVESGIFNIQEKLEQFIQDVIKKKEDYLTNSIVSCCSGDRTSTFLRKILHPTLDVLRTSLNVTTGQLFLDDLWKNILMINRKIIDTDPLRDAEFYEQMLRTLEQILADLTPDSEEALDIQSAQSEEYTSLVEELKYLSMKTVPLISSYYQQQLLEQQDLDSSLATATLVIRTWFKQDETKRILKVHVVMARDIVVPVEESHKKPLEYFVKVQVLCDDVYEAKENSTNIIKEDPATFDQEFEINLNDVSDKDLQNGIILLTLNDHNKTRPNTFLGESYVMLAEVPQGMSCAQNIYLKMTFPVFSEGCQKIIHVLGRRDSDKHAKSFLKKLRKKKTSTVFNLIKRIH